MDSLNISIQKLINSVDNLALTIDSKANRDIGGKDITVRAIPVKADTKNTPFFNTVLLILVIVLIAYTYNRYSK